MRALPLAVAAVLLVSLASLAPEADAMRKACASARDPACPGVVCVDDDGDGRFAHDECVGPDDVDPCAFRSDCCDGGPFWCPETETAGAPVCTGYVNVLGSKQRACADPAQAPRCGAWSEGWSTPIGYWKTCYGTNALCTPTRCVLDDLEVSGCLRDLCLA